MSATDRGSAGDPSGAAEFLAALRIEGRAADGLPPALRPADVDAGYVVQEGLVERLVDRYGGRRIGWKVACTNRHAQELLATPAPVWGRLLSAFAYPSPARLDPAAFTRRVIEPEFAFVVATDVPVDGGPWTRERIVEHLGAALPAIEIVDHRFPGWEAFDAPTLVADNAIHGAWVAGDPVERWRALDLAAAEVRLYANGALVRTGSGALVLGHPLEAVVWLADALAARGETLRAGERITTGTATEVYAAEPEERIAADFGPLGRVEVAFER